MRGNFFGYETYMIVDGSLRNISDNGAATGFAIDLRIANYRGYLLSQIEDVRICVDGEWMPRESLRFAINGREYSLDEMENVTDNRWGWLDTATLTCRKPGGLAPGAHEITVEEHIRPSYIPMTACAWLTRTVELR
jgi:hypothetical protein